MAECGHMFKFRKDQITDQYGVSTCNLCGARPTAEHVEAMRALDSDGGMWAPSVAPEEVIPFGAMHEVAAAADASLGSTDTTAIDPEG